MNNQSKNFRLIADYYEQHRDEILGFVSKQLQYAYEAEDIVQNVSVRLLCSDKMITPVTLPNLVYTIARNLVCDYWRHHRFVEEYEHYIIGSGKSDSMDAVSVYGIMEMTEILERGIAHLSDSERVIYRMNLFEGLQVSEISKTLHINYKSVENRLGAARKEIRQYMKRVLAS